MVYYQLDHLGTPIAAHNAKGEAVWTAEYEAWGRIRNETVSDGLKANIPFRFQGQYYDEESGLHYNRFRYYDPQIGRFISQDPIGFAGSDNFYEYALNPIMWIDPYGLAPCKKKVANPRINMEHIFQGEINRKPQEHSEAQPELVYYQLDHLGTPIAAHNAKGEAVWTSEYEAWGRIRNETVSDGLKVNIPFRFQGQYYDEESGLHYNRFRYYDPEIGRFVSQDPIGLKGGENLYAYVNNPNQWVDILGLSKRKGASAKDCSSECQLRDHCGSGSGQKPWSMRYEENSGKHKKNGYWLGKNWVAPKPTNGNLSLKTSIPFREKGRIGYDAVNNEVIQFNRHRVDESNCVEYWHGFVINNQPVPMKEEAKKIAKTLGYKGKK